MTCIANKIKRHTRRNDLTHTSGRGGHVTVAPGSIRADQALWRDKEKSAAGRHQTSRCSVSPSGSRPDDRETRRAFAEQSECLDSTFSPSPLHVTYIPRTTMLRLFVSPPPPRPPSRNFQGEVNQSYITPTYVRLWPFSFVHPTPPCFSLKAFQAIFLTRRYEISTRST